MKKLILLTFWLSMAIFSLAQKSNLGLVFNTMKHDFGAIKENEGRVTFVFEFTNEGANPVVIKSVRASCGCTTPNWTKEPIATGKKGEIAVTYNPQNRPGVFSKNITIVLEAAGGKQETLVAVISGEVLRERHNIKIGSVSLDKKFLSFKEVKKDGKIRVDTISIFNNSAEPVVIAFDKKPKYITVKLTPKFPVAGQKSNMLVPSQTGLLEVIYDTKKSEQWGIHTDSLEFVLNGKRISDPQNRLCIFANLKEDFSSLTKEDLQKAPIAELSENKIELGDIKKGSVATKTISLKNPGLSTLKIRYVDPFCDFVRITPAKTTIESGKSTDLKIEILTELLPEISFRKRVELVTNDPKFPNQYITLDWKIVK